MSEYSDQFEDDAIIPDFMESYTCSACKNEFWVEDVGEMQDINRPSYCAYCGCEFQWLLEAE
jgi:hypothetical protein